MKKLEKIPFHPIKKTIEYPSDASCSSLKMSLLLLPLCHGSWNRDSESLGAGFCNTPLQSIYTHQLIVKCSSIYIYLRLSSHTFCTYIIAFMSLFFTSLNIDVSILASFFVDYVRQGFMDT